MPPRHLFFSDNAARVHPAVMAALDAANAPDTAYDGDALSARLNAVLSDLFETPCDAIWLTSGTAANSIAVAQYCRPWQAVLCHSDAHIEVDECGAPAFFSGGAKLMLVPGDGGIIDPAALAARLASIRPDVHQVQPALVSITNLTESGRAWTPDGVRAIADVAHGHGLALHMDGARFANALAHRGCAPADLTWRAGVDALSLGFTKNGAMMAEALVFFGAERIEQARVARKRSGHLLSKGRFVAAQILAMLADDLWLANARAANAGAQALARAAPDRLLHPVEGNQLFLRLTPDEAARLRAQGFDFYDWGPDAARLVVSWDQPQDAPAVDALAAALAAL